MNFNFLKKTIEKEDGYFLNFPEFIERDNRTKRNFNPVSLEQMTKKHKVLFPDEIVKGKSILDLGCCLGATGHWCLSAGAKSYTGVETQKEYADIAAKLLEKYHGEKAQVIQSSIEDFLNINKEKFDIVCMLGVIYVFVDYFSILKRMSDVTNEYIVIENLYPNPEKINKDFCGVQFVDSQPINLASENSSLLGNGVRISPKGLEFIMKILNFESKEGILYPEKILKSKDIYNVTLPAPGPVRYLMRFIRNKEIKQISLSDDLNLNKQGKKKEW